MPTDAQIEAARVVLRDKYQIWLNPIAIKAALEAADAAGWQTMDNALKEEYIQVFNGISQEIVHWVEWKPGWFNGDVIRDSDDYTHWRPLPAPPSPTGES